jgi:hypothetical protein
VGAAGFVGEEGMFCGGAVQGDEFGFAEAHLRGDFVFAEERGVKHCRVVSGEHYRDAMAEELRQGVLLQRKLTKDAQAETWTLRQNELALFHGHASERIIGDEQIAIQVGVIHKRRKVGRGGYGTRTGDHAAEHHF